MWYTACCIYVRLAAACSLYICIYIFQNDLRRLLHAVELKVIPKKILKMSRNVIFFPDVIFATNGEDENL